MFKHMYFEISGMCNAKCPWCARQCSAGNSFLDNKTIGIEDFKKSIDYLLNNMILSSNALVCLYNWGEPFLNPDLPDIINCLSDRGLKVGLSTNGSILRQFSSCREMKNVQYLSYTVPGFSQESFYRINGLEFESVKQNIVKQNEIFRIKGFSVKPTLKFLIYQFNIKELDSAIYFAKLNGMAVNAFDAYIQSYETYRDFIKSSLPYQTLYAIARDLMLHDINERRQNMPENFRCPQFNRLVIDEFSRVVLCCFFNSTIDHFVHGNLFSMDLQKITKLKQSEAVCRECISLGLSYLVHNPGKSIRVPQIN